MAKAPQNRDLEQSTELPTGWMVDKNSGEVQDPESKRFMSVEQAKRTLTEREDRQQRRNEGETAQPLSDEQRAALRPPPDRAGVNEALRNEGQLLPQTNVGPQRPEEELLPDSTVARALAASRAAPHRGGNLAARAMGEGTRTMVFPRAIILTLDDFSRIEFKSGVNEVPESLLEHDYLLAAGMEPYNKEAPDSVQRGTPQPASGAAPTNIARPGEPNAG